ncbi:excalibur calcium-binding domain-containing protein [Sphingopyxis bauzanensis]|uniref:excalibur calcium-binding domain-containing protein n=1 Tax=Sphingopyxis bauzanensis TaxID=651663 RepID=UPI0027E57558|nr:excalibur calcium-binding domain-containing protein [Sphingopyxis bauzanensis]
MLVGLGLISAAAVGGWAFASPEQRAAAVSTAKQVAVATGAVGERAPREGDHWSGCNDARAAGTAPIHRGEPSNREGMDGDGEGDGIACERYRWPPAGAIIIKSNPHMHCSGRYSAL